MPLKGKTALITGGSRGIGRAVGERLAREGADIVLVSRSQEGSDTAAAEIRKSTGVRVQSFAADVADAHQAAAVMAKLDRLDILVNNAGICHLAKPFADLPLEAWQETLGVNLLGIVNFTRLAIPLLKRQGEGKIVNIASLAGEVGGIATAADYVASKAAVIGLTKSLARELGPDGINVNAVAPGFVRTSMAEKMDIQLAAIPLRRIAEPADIAGAVHFLSSEDARCITGMVLDVNGGLYMG